MTDSTRRRWVAQAAGLTALAARASGAIFDVRQYQAEGDGRTVNTLAIQKAIDECSASGGGRVLFENGKYVTGTLFLRSNVTLFVEAGAMLLGSPYIADYPTGTHRNMYAHEPHMDRCLLFARDAVNIGLEGQGTIDGQGKSFPNRGDAQKNRPMLIRFLDCANVFLRDLTLQNPAAWTAAILYSRDIRADAVNIVSRANANGDGLDFDGCQNVRVSNCRFDTSDDSICLQASETDKPVRNVVITNCIMCSRWAAIRIGLLSRGDFEDVTVSNCLFHDIVGEGLKIQMAEGGRMNNLLFSNIVMRNVPRAVFLTFNSFPFRVDAPGPPPPMRSLRNVVFNSMQIESDASSAESRNSFLAVIGLPGHPIENVTFSNIAFTAPGGGTREDAERRAVPELTGIRPEHRPLGEALPAYGLYARHVRGLTLTNVRFDVQARDLRPGVVCDDVEELSLTGVRVHGDPQAEHTVRLRNTKDALIQSSFPLGEVPAFVQVEGAASSGVALLANDLRRVRRAVVLADGASPEAVTAGSNLGGVP